MNDPVKFVMERRLMFCVVALVAAAVFSTVACNGCSGSGNRNSGGNNSNNGSDSTAIPDPPDYMSGKAPSVLQPFNNDITASELVAEIKIGWNLGNTLDTNDLGWLGSNPSVSRMETAWSNPVTTKEIFTALKGAGFNAVRIPVSWTKAADSNYVIRNDWMERVTEIVNYAADNDMYIVINTHHDEDVFKFTNTQEAKSLEAFRIIWMQIATNFKNYNEKLIFEGLNEPRTKDSAAEWSGGTLTEHIILNKYYQLFVDTVRASGGNNGKRMLIVNTYAASAEQIAINALVVPKDTADKKIIVSIHAYAPYNFALNQGDGAVKTWSKNNDSDKSGVNTPLDRAYNKFVSGGYPVIMGEFGAVDRDNEDARAEWAEYYVSYARSKGIPCFWWDNGLYNRSNGEQFAILDRYDNTFPFPKIIAALMEGSK
jgi:endoglucanase